MRYKGYKLERRESRKPKGKKFLRLILLLSILGVILYTINIFVFQKPKVKDLRSLTEIPAYKQVVLKLEPSSGIKQVSVKILQGQKEVVLYNSAPAKDGTVSLKIIPKQMGLEDGKAQVLISLRYGLIGRRTYRVDANIDTIPPTVNLLSYTEYVPQGGTGAVKVKVKDGAYVYLYVGQDKYAMYPVGNGEFFTLYPVKVDQDPSTPIKVVAFDNAGNISALDLRTKIGKGIFRVDRIKLSDEFIDKVITPLIGKHLPPILAFKEVNEVWRKRDVEKLMRIGLGSKGEKLWNGNFLQLPHSKVISTFGDIRYYYYKGEEISTSRHMGYDFASVQESPVPASNDGIVVFTGKLGIYGNAVVIDHGFGLMSLYGHLSRVTVREGQAVKKGDIIGNTGSTGLALGDHLHFGILVHGIEVNPKEWLDAKWIKTRIERVFSAQ